MKILHVNKGYKLYGGVEHYIRLLVANNVAGYFIDVLAINDSFKYRSYTENESNILEVPLLINLKSLRIGMFFNLAFLLKVWNYDVVHFHYPNPNGEILALITSVLFRKKVVYTFHNEVSSDKPASKLYSRFSKIVLSKAKKVIATSPQIIQTSDLLIALRKSNPDILSVIPLGIEIKDVPDFLDSKSGSLRVVFVGRLVPLKGVEYLIESVKNLPGITLEVVGDGVLMTELIALGGDNVSLHGYVSTSVKERILESADVLVLPSINRGEGFGYVILEAMQNYCAIVSTNLGTGTSYANVDSLTGLVIPPKDVESLTNALVYLRDNHEVLDKMKRNSRDRVSSIFAISQVKKNIIEIYEAI